MLEKTKQKIRTKVYQPVAEAASLAVLALCVAILAILVALTGGGK